MSKICAMCKEERAYKDFYTWKWSGQRSSYCDACRLALAHDYNKRNREKKREYSKEYRQHPKIKEQISEYQRMYYQKNKDRISTRKAARYKARQATAKEKAAAKLGAITRREIPIFEPCEVCGKTKDVHRHHDDCSKPLIVRFLCRKHHMRWHADQKRKKTVDNSSQI